MERSLLSGRPSGFEDVESLLGSIPDRRDQLQLLPDPKREGHRGLVTTTPDSFTFTLKAPRRITHDARLQLVTRLLEAFLDRARTLGDKLGVLLFQLSPSFRADLDIFDRFLNWPPPGMRAAFEFRLSSWFPDDVYDRMRARNLALCVTDNEKPTTPDVVTADFGYFRLRDEGYAPDDISRWADVVRERESDPWKQAFVYFKHEDEGKGPEFARALMGRLPA